MNDGGMKTIDFRKRDGMSHVTEWRSAIHGNV